MTASQPSTGTPSPAAGTSPAPKRAGRLMVNSQHNDGWLMAVELVTATFTWGGIGYLADRFWLGTYPVLMSIGFVIGFFAGMYLLWLKTSAPAEPPGSDAAAGADADA